MPSKKQKSKASARKGGLSVKPLTKKEEDEILKALSKTKGSCPCGS